MSWKVNFTFFVHQKHKWNPLNLEVLNERMCTIPTQKCQMFNLCPSFGVNSIFNHLFVIIDADSNNSYFSLPFFFIFLKHLLVVFHRILARTTPSCPNINKQNFSRLMGQFCLFIRKDFVEIFVNWHFFTDTKSLRKINRQSSLI